ncbi:MAG: rhizobiocin/RTX toxin and hemolysin-type calcium binding protein [Rhodocyclaceae bacterium]|nr:MAG: rhizobiocin/RTX toxin and hemolysin-type calcium binding protein [Rhodocyclaceae bacterium]TNC99972.1 MAG: Ca2+-binding protein, RTX toxin [Rhodocyclaceae bacterium]
MAIINVPTTIDTNVAGTNADDFIYSIVDPFIASSGGIQTLFGGLGNDTYILGNTGAGAATDTIIEVFGEGIDTAVLYTNVTGSYTLANNVENLISRRVNTIFNSTLPGSAANSLIGNALNNIISVDDGNLGGAGISETIDGGLGNDTMSGGHGNDTYNVDSAQDVIVESNTANLTGSGQVNGGALVNGFANGVVLNGFIDSVNATVSYTLGLAVENLTLSGSANINGTGNLLPNIITGNTGNNILDGQDGSDMLSGGSGNDTLKGGGGNDLLDGGAGNDTMDGGAGDDTYRMDSALDFIIGDAGGVDTVQLTNSATFNAYVLPGFIENTLALGAFAVNLTGNALDNQLFGNTGNDTLTGGDGNDTLDGGTGTDTLSGGKGNDVYVLDSSSDIIVAEKPGEGTDTVFVTLTAGQTFTLASEMERLYLTGTANANGTGNALDNTLVGNSGNNTLLGLAGNDNINGLAGNDMLSGGLGNDILDGDAGNDSISGGAGNDTLFGGAGNDIMEGGDGADTMDGGAGVDNMAGGAGNDIYFVTDLTGTNPQTRDIVFELPGTAGGTDTVNSSVTISQLFANVENLNLTGASNIDGIGNELANTINGNAGENFLDAGHDALADTLVGGLGNDTYLIYGTNDVVTEVANVSVPAPGTGLLPGYTDTVVYRGTAAYTLAANVENLMIDVSRGNVDVTGNLLDNRMMGSSGNNKLDGAGGNDMIYGGDGNDTLIGGAGNDMLDGNLGVDTLQGGAGDDSYVVENANDIVDELAGGTGNDTVMSFLRDINIDTAFNGNMKGAIENITLGGGALNATGNALVNILKGNALSNVLTGGAGNDTYFADLTDQVIEGNTTPGGVDTVNLDVGSNALNVNVRFGVAPVPLIPRGELWNVENVTLLGTGNSNVLFEHNTLTSTQANTLIGNDGNNILDGAGGADTMTGLKGNDVYYVDNVGDKTIEVAGQGTDTVYSSVTWTLPSDVENMTLIGSGTQGGTGNTLDNVLRGNGFVNTLTGLAGNDTLDGGGGNDTMNGADGDDTYWVDSVGDVVQDTTGTDTVISTITGANGYNLTTAASVENLVLFNGWAVPPAVMNGTGNALDNRITANLSKNTIDGGGGSDTLDFNLVGSLLANDTLVGGLGNDTVSSDTLLADITSFGGTANLDEIETAILRAEGGFNGSIDFGAGGWEDLRAVNFTGSAGRTLTVNSAPNTGNVNNAVPGAGVVPVVFGLTDFDGSGVTINSTGTLAGSSDVLNLAIRDSGLNAALNTADWETIKITEQPSADGSFAANNLSLAALGINTTLNTIIEVTGSGGGQLNLTNVATASLSGGAAWSRDLQFTVVNFADRLQITQSGGANVAQVNVQDSSFWLDAVGTNALEIFAKGPVGTAPSSTSLVHLNEQTTNNATITLGGAANSVLTVDGIRATAINASAFAGSNLYLVAEGTTAGTWTGPSVAINPVDFSFTGGGGGDTFNFNTAGMVDGMDQVDGGAGTDIVNVNITGMGVSGTAMSGGLHFFNTETINFNNNAGNAVIDASMMDGNVTMVTNDFLSTTIHGLAGGFNGGGRTGAVTIYANNNASGVTYQNFGTGTQTLFGSQMQGVGDTFTMGGVLDDNDFIQGWDFDTVAADSFSATLAGGTLTPKIQGVENITLTNSTAPSEIHAVSIVGAMNWTLNGSQTLTLNGGSTVSPMNGATGMYIDASLLTAYFEVDGSIGADTIAVGTLGSHVDGWDGNDTITGGAGIDIIRGDEGNDTITGAGGADELYGGAGNDTFMLGTVDSANDAVDGGAGSSDAVDYNGSVAVTVALPDTGMSNGHGSGTGLGTDVLGGIERVLGSGVADILAGSHNVALTSTAADASRTYVGRGGNDTIDGNGAEKGYNDFPDYSSGAVDRGVFVNLGGSSVTVNAQTVAAGTATDMAGGTTYFNTDTLTNVDGAFGSSFADVLIGGSASLAYSGNLFEFWIGNGGNDIIAGNAGAFPGTGGNGIVSLLDLDMVDYGSGGAGVRVDLRLGIAQDGLGGTDTLFDINIVRGSAFDDMLTGGNAQNDFYEAFEGRKGDDHIDGGTGYDLARYNLAASKITADLSTGVVTDGDGGTDTLVNIEGLRGSDFDDSMKGSANNDFFEGAAGNDTIDGGAGIDRVDYTNDKGTVVVNLAAGTADDSWGNTDTLISIEAVRGSGFDDYLTGSSNAAGTIESFEGRGGADSIEGSGGIDLVTYANAHGPVTANLSMNAAPIDGDGGSDILNNIENLRGSFYGDTLTGSNADNRIEGAASKYWTYANTGTNDSDTLTGNAGNDTFVFNSAPDATYNLDTITDYSEGDKIELDRSIFVGLTAGSGITGSFITNAGAPTPLDANDYILYNSSTGALYYDADGAGAGLAVQFATLAGPDFSGLAGTDFIVV